MVIFRTSLGLEKNQGSKMVQYGPSIKEKKKRKKERKKRLKIAVGLKCCIWEEPLRGDKIDGEQRCAAVLC